MPYVQKRTAESSNKHSKGTVLAMQAGPCLRIDQIRQVITLGAFVALVAGFPDFLPWDLGFGVSFTASKSSPFGVERLMVCRTMGAKPFGVFFFDFLFFPEEISTMWPLRVSRLCLFDIRCADRVVRLATLSPSPRPTARPFLPARPCRSSGPARQGALRCAGSAA